MSETSSIATAKGAFTWTHVSREITFGTHNSTEKLKLKLSFASGRRDRRGSNISRMFLKSSPSVNEVVLFCFQARATLKQDSESESNTNLL